MRRDAKADADAKATMRQFDAWLHPHNMKTVTDEVADAIASAEDRGFKRGAKAAADLAAQYATTHPYRLDDCILAKLNLTDRKPRRNAHRVVAAEPSPRRKGPAEKPALTPEVDPYIAGIQAKTAQRARPRGAIVECGDTRFCYVDHTTGDSDHMNAHPWTAECVRQEAKRAARARRSGR